MTSHEPPANRSRGRRPEGDPAARAHEAALRLLGYRARSQAELGQRLLQRGFAANVVASELERLSAAGLLDDEAFAAAWVEERSRLSPRGTHALRRELRQRGVSREIIDSATAHVDDRATALEIAVHRAIALRNAPYESFARRLAGHLQRRGIDAATAAWATHRAWEETRPEGHIDATEDAGFL
jgi:regulatory protein